MPEIYTSSAAAEQNIITNISGLTFDIAPFDWFNSSGTKQSNAGSVGLSIPSNTTAYYEINGLSGLITSNTLKFTPGMIPLAAVASDATDIIDVDIYENRPNSSVSSGQTAGSSLIQDQLDGTYNVISFDFYSPVDGQLLSFQGSTGLTLTPNSVIYLEIDENSDIYPNFGSYLFENFQFAIITTNGDNEIINIKYNTNLFNDSSLLDAPLLGFDSPIYATKGSTTFSVYETAFVNTVPAGIISTLAEDIDPVDGAFTYVSWDNAGVVQSQTGSFPLGATTPIGIVRTNGLGIITEIWDATMNILNVLDDATVDYEEVSYTNISSGTQTSPTLIDSNPTNGIDTYYELTPANEWNIVGNGPYTPANTPGLFVRTAAGGTILRIFNFLTNPAGPIVDGASSFVFNVNSFNYVDTTGTTRLFLGAAAIDPVDNEINYVSVTNGASLNVTLGGFPTGETPVGIVYTDGAGNITRKINASVDHDPSVTIDLPTTSYLDTFGVLQSSDELLNYNPPNGVVTYIELTPNGEWGFESQFTPGYRPVAVIQADGSGNITRIVSIFPTGEISSPRLKQDFGEMYISVEDGDIHIDYDGMPKVKVITINRDTYYIVKTQEYVENTTDGILVILNEDGVTVNATYTMNNATKLITIT